MPDGEISGSVSTRSELCFASRYPSGLGLLRFESSFCLSIALNEVVDLKVLVLYIGALSSETLVYFYSSTCSSPFVIIFVGSD